MDPQSFDELKALTQLDIDAFYAVDQAIRSVDDQAIRERLRELQGDHERHIMELSSLIEAEGGKPPAFSRDFKGFIITGIAAARSMMGTEGALNAMKRNAEVMITAYRRGLEYEMPPRAADALRRYLDDVQRHSAWLGDAIAHRTWDMPKLNLRGAH